MTNYDRAREMVNDYVKEHGRETQMTTGEFVEFLRTKYENINKGNVQPTDICFNLYNKGLVDFPGPNLCLMYVFETERFKLVGSDYKPEKCDVIQYKGRKNEQIVGEWKDGKFGFLPEPVPTAK